MNQYHCHHPEYGGGGWGHPWPEEEPYPHACCITCCPHATREQRVRAGREAEVRWIFLWPGSLDVENDTRTITLTEEDLPEVSVDPEVGTLVVLSDFTQARLYAIGKVDGLDVTFHSADGLARRLEALRLEDRDEAIAKAEKRLKGGRDA